MSRRGNFHPHKSRGRKGHNRKYNVGEEPRRHTNESTFMETSMLEEYMSKGTLLRVRLDSNEEFTGRIEWYDQNVINLALADGSQSVVVFKHAVTFCEAEI